MYERVRLGEATAPVHFIPPERGMVRWDRPGCEVHDSKGAAVFDDAFRS